ncbi:hypothetical protein DRJ48_04530 [Candidatus Woesearchaeota archaeon]|nr:MAG: hypothetical protein DRJ48_04530 [Candidatus Woesearchaeota archaeon]
MVHYCTAKLKASVQLAERIKLRARGIAKPFDRITQQGTIIHGAIYLPGLEPGANYKERLKSAKNKEILQEQLVQIVNGAGIKEWSIDERRIRVLCSLRELKKTKEIVKRLGGVAAIVEEYPTYDGFIIEVDFI